MLTSQCFKCSLLGNNSNYTEPFFRQIDTEAQLMLNFIGNLHFSLSYNSVNNNF